MKRKYLNYILVFVLILLVTNNVLAYDCGGKEYVSCGGNSVNAVTGIPAFVPRLISFAIALMRVLIPVILIITGTIEMFKSIISGNPDNISKGKKKIIGKYIGALLAFFIISFTTNIVKLIARGDEKSVAAKCFNCYLNNNCDSTEFSCQGTIYDKEEYLKTLKCTEIKYSDCPTDRCIKDGTQKKCVERTADADLSNVPCRSFNTPELRNSCPLDRCKRCYGSDIGTNDGSSCEEQDYDCSQGITPLTDGYGNKIDGTYYTPHGQSLKDGKTNIPEGFREVPNTAN